MKHSYYILFFFITSLSSGQVFPDSIKKESSSKLSYKKFILPVGLMVGGFSLLHTRANDAAQEGVAHLVGSDYQNRMDDYLQFAPVAEIYAGRLLGLESKHSVAQMTANIVVAELMVTGVTQGLKHVFNVERPDGTDNFSFPSGHTATAFSSATVLFYEYKDSNIFYASSGFLFATATGFMRMANNKHRLSDVMAGAGIGILAGTIADYWSPFSSKLGKKAHVYPVVGMNYSVGVIIVR